MASAKGIQQTLAIVSGPGLDRALVLDQKEWGIPQDESSPQAFVIGKLIGDLPKDSSAPADGLGPAYEIHYQLSAYDPRAERLQRFGLPEQPPGLSSLVAADLDFPLGLSAAAVTMALGALAIRKREPLLAP